MIRITTFLIVGVVGASIGFLSGCDVCRDDIKGTVVSPDGKHRVVSLVRDCGATTDFATQVVLERNSAIRWTSERIFVVKGDHHVDTNWKSNDSLQIVCHSCGSAHVFTEKGEWNGIKITYEGTDR